MSWYWKSDLRLKDDDESSWTAYSSSDSTKIEKAFNKGQKTFTLNNKYKIDFKTLIQVRKDDANKQRAIKRVEKNEDNKNNKKRKADEVEDVNNNNNEKKSPKKKAKKGAKSEDAPNPGKFRTGGQAKTFYFTEYEDAVLGHDNEDDDDDDYEKKGKAKKKIHPEKTPLEEIVGKEAKNVQHGDLLYFADYRGTGLFVAESRNNKIYMVKTLGEYGYILPRQFRVVPESYYNDDNISIGFEDLKEYGSDIED